jgi:hypothetical protein
MSNTINKSRELDNKITELEKVLYRLKCFLDIHKIIGLNYKKINAMGWGKLFFWEVQDVTLQSYVLGIHKVFEKEKSYELNSLPFILKTAKDCKPKDEQALKDFVSKYIDLLSHREGRCSNSQIAEIEEIYAKFYQKYFIEDDRLKKVRNKIIAHSEDIEDVKRPKDLPSYDVMEKLLHFAIDIHSAISNGYLEVCPHPIKSDERAFSSTCAVLEKLGVSNVKTKFDDE